MSADKKGTGMRPGKVWQLTCRGHRLLWQVSARYTFFCYLSFVLKSFMPCFDIWLSARLLDEVATGRDPVRLIGLTAVLLSGTLVLQLVQELAENTVRQEYFLFVQKERMVFIRKIMELDYCLLEDESVYRLYQRVDRESYNDRKNLEALRYEIPNAVSHLAAMGTAVFMMWEFFAGMWEYRNWMFFAAVLTAAGIWASFWFFAANEKDYEKYQIGISENCSQRDGYARYLDEYHRGKEIRIFGLGELLINRLMETHAFNDRMMDDKNRKTLRYVGSGSFFSEIALALVRSLAVFAVLAGKLSLGGMTRFAQSAALFIDHAGQLRRSLISLWYNAEYLERYFEFLDMESSMKKGCIPVEKRADMEYKIVFDHVSFRYPGSDRYALKDICLEFEIGEKLAVVGMNGSGKSTFIKLLCRLYDPTEGTIYLNGIDIRRYNYEEYLSLFSVVFQDFKLFSFSLGENVAMAEEYEEETVKAALEKAGLEQFLQSRKKGIRTTLYREFDEEGTDVSGGEAQKLALARAVCKGAPFVLLDEPTAALDPLAEYEIYNRFNELVADRTTVYISHRMSSCRFCRDIAVFHEGRLLQRGSHEALMQETDGKYFELWSAQAQYYQT